MADEQKGVIDEGAAGQNDNVELSVSYDPRIPVVYTNNAEVILGKSDISIVLLQDIDFQGNVKKPLTRVIMSHDNFMSFVSYCNKTAKLLETLYDGRPKNLLTISKTSEEVEKAIQDMYSSKQVEAKFEFIEEEGNDNN